MPFEDNLKARMDAGEHPTLYGYSDTLQKELTTVKEVAEFIYTEGLKGDVLITTSDGMPFISTFGIFLNRIADMDYRVALLDLAGSNTNFVCYSGDVILTISLEMY